MQPKFILGSGLLSLFMMGSVQSIETEVDNNIQYVWDFGDGSTSNEKAPKHDYSEVGIYQAKLMVFQNEKLVDTRVNTIDLVSPLINQIAIEHTLSALSVSMSAVIDVKQALNLTHSWSVEEQTYNGLNASHDFSDYGEYSIKLSSYFGEHLVYETQVNILATELEPEPEPEQEENTDDDSSGGTIGGGSLLFFIAAIYRRRLQRTTP